MTAPPKKTSFTPQAFFIWGCLAPVLLIIVVMFVLAIWLGTEPEEPEEAPEFIKKAENQVDARAKKLSERLVRKKPQHDPDQTMMAIYSIEQALEKSKKFEDLTPLILQQDSDLIAPDRKSVV